MLKIDRDIIALDIESTGSVPAESHITQVAFQRLRLIDGVYTSISEWKTYVKPPIPIPAMITELTGITDEMVANAPVFSEIAQKVVKALRGCDIMAYNGWTLDLPILAEECERCGVPFLKINEFTLIDPYTIFCIEEPRTLTAAVKFYCQEELDDAHDALNDVRGMVKVFNAQLNHYAHIPSSIEEFKDYQNRGKKEYFADYARKLVWKEGVLYWGNWGNCKNQPVLADYSFMQWVLSKDFPNNTKEVIMNWCEEVEEKEKQNY